MRNVWLLVAALSASSCFHNTSVTGGRDQRVSDAILDVDVSESDASDLGSDALDLAVDVADLGVDATDLAIDATDLDTDATDLGTDQGVCPFGAHPSGSCKQPQPANSLSFSQEQTILSVGHSDTLQIDTTTCMDDSGRIGDSSDPLWCVFRVKQLVVETNGVLEVIGDRFLAVLASESVEIRGLIDAGGHKEITGPGGGAGGVLRNQAGQGDGGGKACTCNDLDRDDCGGGGGGYATIGGAGGTDWYSCSTPSYGGGEYGDPALVPMKAGSGGASGGQSESDEFFGQGGGGGGGLQISSAGTFLLEGSVNAGGGGGFAVQFSYGEASGGGGGSGGGILLEAQQIDGKGIVAANGGGGGGGRPGGCNHTVQDGDDGEATTNVASGGRSFCYGNYNGGSGGGVSAPEPGQSGEYCGAGGGGAAGRIRLNTYEHGSNQPALVTSPPATFGEMAAY